MSYSDTILAVENFKSRRISPLAAPYLLEKAWEEGYISATGTDGGWETVEYALGYGTQQLTVTTAFSGGIPVYAEISDGKNTLISCEITELQIDANKEKEVTNNEDAQTDMGGGQS